MGRREALEASGQYVHISPIPPDTQKEWMEEYVRNHEGLRLDDAPIHVDEWWNQFSAWLREIDVGLARDWNRFRTGKVLGFLREWATENNVPLNNLLSPDQSDRRTRSSGIADDRAARTAPESQRVRDAILAALREMPLEQLEEVAIPMRYILRHFKPSR